MKQSIDCDLDIYLDLTKEKIWKQRSKQYISEKICQTLKNNPDFIKIEAVLNARVPIIRFVDKNSGIMCDLGFTSASKMSVMNTRFLQLCQKTDPRYIYQQD